METQLVNRYLHTNDCRYGLYLVGWFLCDQWSDEDSRKAATIRLNHSIEETRLRLHSQAEGFSEGEVKVEAVVIDATLR
jgi:hypothetical protein